MPPLGMPRCKRYRGAARDVEAAPSRVRHDLVRVHGDDLPRVEVVDAPPLLPRLKPFSWHQRPRMMAMSRSAESFELARRLMLRPQVRRRRCVARGRDPS